MAAVPRKLGKMSEFAPVNGFPSNHLNEVKRYQLFMERSQSKSVFADFIEKRNIAIRNIPKFWSIAVSFKEPNPCRSHIFVYILLLL